MKALKELFKNSKLVNYYCYFYEKKQNKIERVLAYEVKDDFGIAASTFCHDMNSLLGQRGLRNYGYSVKLLYSLLEERIGLYPDKNLKVAVVGKSDFGLSNLNKYKVEFQYYGDDFESRNFIGCPIVIITSKIDKKIPDFVEGILDFAYNDLSYHKGTIINIDITELILLLSSSMKDNSNND